MGALPRGTQLSQCLAHHRLTKSPMSVRLSMSRRTLPRPRHMQAGHQRVDFGEHAFGVTPELGHSLHRLGQRRRIDPKRLSHHRPHASLGRTQSRFVDTPPPPRLPPAPGWPTPVAPHQHPDATTPTPSHTSSPTRRATRPTPRQPQNQALPTALQNAQPHHATTRRTPASPQDLLATCHQRPWRQPNNIGTSPQFSQRPTTDEVTYNTKGGDGTLQGRQQIAACSPVSPLSGRFVGKSAAISRYPHWHIPAKAAEISPCTTNATALYGKYHASS